MAGTSTRLCKDLHETDDLRVLDFNGERAFRVSHLRELGTPIMIEARG